MNGVESKRLRVRNMFMFSSDSKGDSVRLNSDARFPDISIHIFYLATTLPLILIQSIRSSAHSPSTHHGYSYVHV